MGEVLGTGADAKVVRATRRSDGGVFAIKVIDLKQSQDGAAFDGPQSTAWSGRLALEARAARMRRELEIHANLPEHPHVVTCYEVFSGARRSHLVLGLCAGGTLLDCVCGDDAARLLQEPGAARIARQVLVAIRFLHTNGVVHRDIKLENLLLRDKIEGSSPVDAIHIQLADFGSARYLRKRSFERSATAHVGTLAYMAPEQHVGGTVDASLDMWSFGIVLAALCTGRHPLRDVPRDEWHREMQQDRLPDGASAAAAAAWAVMPEARDLARSVLRLESSARITALQALEHPWIVRNAAPCASAASPAENTAPEQEQMPQRRPRRTSFVKDFRSTLKRRGAQLIGLRSAPHPQPRRRRSTAPAAMPFVESATVESAQPRTATLDRSSKSASDLKSALEPDASRRGSESRDDSLRLPRLLAGLRDVRRTRLQKTLLVLVALRANDVEVRPALALYEEIAPNKPFLAREDVEDALLEDDDVSLRAADQLCEAFEELSLDGSGKVSHAEFVAGVLSLRRRSRFDLVDPVLRDLDPNRTGKVYKQTLADTLRHLKANPNPRGSTGNLISAPPLELALPTDDQLDSLLADAFTTGPYLTYDQVVDLLFPEPAEDDDDDDDATAT